MKATPLQSYNQSEISLIQDALRIYMGSVPITAARIILTDYIKVMKKGNQVQLDGMGMEHIYYALLVKSNKMASASESSHLEVQEVRKMAQEIRKKRIHFQQTFYKTYMLNEDYRSNSI
ncbi:hypothetical protein [Halalkalibacter hemicellulosilyticus]|uniref:Uncharacterized protein n=1 Tax=Halalkalibacter hemicellulosilyticusJCM 9152 TaxID=1236971 RepID=W4QDM8_9BACI|nr:hypothetical protein [Halalkalibacter hemicellulosilyticus]GAE29793.1 hypothetical protein JCM9152_1177 [Halalkalibacter hemicellulosilyticusJCM 9152]